MQSQTVRVHNNPEVEKKLMDTKDSQEVRFFRQFRSAGHSENI